MRRPSSRLLVTAIAAVLLGVQTRAEAFTAAFSWAGIPACQTTSPAFALDQVPVGTRRLRFVMHDLQMPSFQHGGSTIAYNGDAVPRGSIWYIGPCPPKRRAASLPLDDPGARQFGQSARRDHRRGDIPSVNGPKL